MDPGRLCDHVSEKRRGPVFGFVFAVVCVTVATVVAGSLGAPVVPPPP